jgi:transposase
MARIRQQDEANRFPVYYKQFSGDVPDIKAFVDTASDANLNGKDVTLLADKGFGSDENFDFLEESSIPYIVSLKRGSLQAPDIPTSQKEYDKVFAYRGRTIFCKEIVEKGKGPNVFLFYDMELANDESFDMVERQNKTNAGINLRIENEKERRTKSKRRLSDSELQKLEPVDVAFYLNERENTGSFAIKTTRTDLNCRQIYSLYKTRQDIEQCFKSFDNTLDRSASYMSDIHSYEAWQFISHIALQLFYYVLDTIEAKGFTSRYSFKDIIFRLKDVRVNKINDVWKMTKITKSTVSVCKDLGIENDAPEVVGAP